MFRNFEMMGYSGYGVWLIPIMIWAIYWKGLALWRSAKSDEKYWFIALLVIQSWGVLELIYLFVIRRKHATPTTSPSRTAKPKKQK